MKNRLLVITAVFGLLLTGCASVRVLTPQSIDSDIAGLPNLVHCQFFISKNVTLRRQSDARQTSVNETGVVEAQRVITSRTIRIARSTPGILQTRNAAGDALDGYRLIADNKTGRLYLSLSILFEEDDDNAIVFQAFYDNENDRFELYKNEVNYGGLTYTVAYDGEELPYLKYKLLERVVKKSEKRREGNYDKPVYCNPKP